MSWSNEQDLVGALPGVVSEEEAVETSGVLSEAERSKTLSKVIKNRHDISALMQYKCDVLNQSDAVITKGAKKGECLALNRRDLPKFQLASSAVKAFPSEEVFESVDHYLCTFESILNSSSLDLETQWAKLLPLCMPHNDRAWCYIKIIS
ncbi:hypothetical protein [Parasitella parasitica]|uniref:Uncharacterized protein n=1 Tax=Parasitella parasitica TaxID=35722 RepID=A0A0B7MXC3_9FUNG|nr:hypothetical protein [Parasitella parasitica]